MSKLFKRKISYLFAIAGIIFIVILASFKTYEMASMYEYSSLSIQTKIKETAAKIKSGNHELTDEKLGDILNIAAERDLEYLVINWFKRYLFLFIFLFGGTLTFLLFREFSQLD